MPEALPMVALMLLLLQMPPLDPDIVNPTVVLPHMLALPLIVPDERKLPTVITVVVDAIPQGVITL